VPATAGCRNAETDVSKDKEFLLQDAVMQKLM